MENKGGKKNVSQCEWHQSKNATRYKKLLFALMIACLESIAPMEVKMVNELFWSF